MGMSIVTVPNPSSRIILGQNELVGETEAYLSLFNSRRLAGVEEVLDLFF